ncbi:hypothetical protein CPB83DRAFT_847965 [Crepidotus variabilis]|uniref:non-specific serine/threonine protein kinase n=1 Tax=Crepidotus variabilis TaxID=179855 RepID=A0A9P6ELA4_9AGAR|nr:hypothetical protein CPB83DRAFT_847965 [Crepidotus variabilis]
MASQQMFQAPGQNKGTLVPGQTITVNNYAVQVERYLSQGGFAHVYLVRTPAPVYNTTHHVLKRIAVANEAMLTEVKREVDVMRLLKGHPNIVHLIDAAWHKLANGTFEVFILMEYCPGGGIIDMMNRRLRERLTEAEILQIFVDVCEGVAYMHNSRPPLLHRDLKVENILQSSPTSFKLCDFGSATTVSNPPTNMQEIRALEADLNRHTTLQYRAPEMVDVYSKRSVNEKSDVWALGVLLYKLCYYTTPFEEHGPLAILNVQYRIPPYPVYSQDMNMLIASMLREHGAQRPTVFELLVHVHRLRGSKSKFNYTIPVSPPLVPPRPSQFISKSPVPSNPLDGLVSYGTSAKPQMSLYGSGAVGANPTQGIQAREKVLEAIAPMRRGRPNISKESHTSRPSSPQIHKPSPPEPSKPWTDSGFGVDQDRAWQAVTQKSTAPSKTKDDAWTLVDTSTTPATKVEKPRSTGFGDDFAQNLWTSPDPNGAHMIPKPTPSPQPQSSQAQSVPSSAPSKASETPSIPTPLAFTGSRMLRPKQDRAIPTSNQKDAFDGLGLMTNSYKPAPTLGEARKLRTGLAVTSGHALQGEYFRSRPGENQSNSLSPRPSPSPQPSYLSSAPIQGRSLSPLPTPNNTSPGKPLAHFPSSSNLSSSQPDGMPVESRYPSLEELDARFVPSSSSLYPSSVQPQSTQSTSKSSDSRPSQFMSRPSQYGTSLKASPVLSVPLSHDGVRSEQVTGVAMREMKESKKPETRSFETKTSTLDRSTANQASFLTSPTARRPSLIRKHRSSMAMNPHLSSVPSSEKPQHNPSNLEPPKLPTRPGSSSPSGPPQDWLTGEDNEGILTNNTTAEVPVLRDSPSKRASFIAQSAFTFPSGSSAQHVLGSEKFVEEPQSDISPTVSKFKKNFPDVEKIDTQQANATVLSGLSDNWSPVRRNTEPESSSGEEGPEDAGALRSAGLAAVEKRGAGTRHKARQSSVHDLVNQYGGAYGVKEPEKAPAQATKGGDYKPRKTQITGGTLVPPAGRQDTERKTPSPTSNAYRIATTGLSSPSKASNRQQTPNNFQQPKHQPPPSPSKATPAVGRSRPQSMFIFPSKQAGPATSMTMATSIGSSNLTLPPDDIKSARTTRRTSISDMVQKYEAIGGRKTPTLPTGPPSPVHLPIPVKGGVSLENGRKPFLDTSKPIADRLGSPAKTRTNTFDNQNFSLGASPSGRSNRNRIVSDNQKSVLGASENISRVRKLSVRNEATTSDTRTDQLAAARTAVKLSQEHISSPQPSRSPRKPTMSLTQNTEEPRTPVEADRPYQGVGKLIDQWQKKTAEADQSRPVAPAKRSFTPKRVGTIPGDG